MNLPADKVALRRRLRQVRGAIVDREARSVACCTSVASLPAYAAATMVMSFASIGSEVDTGPLHARLAADAKALLLPRIDADEIVAVAVTRSTTFTRSTLGIDEPAGEPVEPASLVGALVVVPGLAFTLGGGRLGYGGGYYDRFLASLPASAVTVGVCFHEQLVDDLPLDPHDVPVRLLVTA